MFSRLVLFVIIHVLKCNIVNTRMSDQSMSDHVQLSIDVKEFYRASSIVNVYNDKHAGSHILLTMFRLSRALSPYGVLSQSMRLSKLSTYVRYYTHRTGLPLYVITLKSMLDLDEFSKFAHQFSMSLNIWLVYFYDSPELLEYCQRPNSNKLNVAFDTKILIKCDGDPIVREWYSVRHSQVKMNDVARWTRKDRFVRVNQRSIWERRNTLDGISIRIATVKDTFNGASNLERHNSTLYGLFGRTLRELSQSMNFTMVPAAMERMYGHYYPEYGNWSGVIGLLVNRQGDIGVGEFGRSPHRLDVIDLAVPLLLAPMNLFYRVPNMTAINWSTYLKVFDRRLWAINAFFAIFCAIIVAIIMSKFKQKPTLSDVTENFFHIWGMQCQQGLPVISAKEFPSAGPLKLAFISLFISSMVTYISYSATLTSYLTLFTPVLPFTNEKEFLKDLSYRLIVLRGSLYYDVIMLSNDSLAKKMRKRMKRVENLPGDMYEAYQQVCTEKVVLYTNEVFVNKLGSQIRCKFTSLYTGRLESASYALTKRSPFKGILNYYIEKFRVHGILHVLQNRYLHKLEASSSQYSPVSIWNVTPILTLYLNGVLLSLIMLLCERSLCCLGRSRRRCQDQRRLQVQPRRLQFI